MPSDRCPASRLSVASVGLFPNRSLRMDGRPQRCEVLAPAGFAGSIAGQLESDRGNLPIDAGPRSEAAGSWITDRRQHGVLVVPAHEPSQLFAGAVKIVAVLAARDRVERDDAIWLPLVDQLDEQLRFRLAGGLLATEVAAFRAD